MRFRIHTPPPAVIEPPARRLVRRQAKASCNRRYTWQDKIERGEDQRLARLAQQLHLNV